MSLEETKLNNPEKLTEIIKSPEEVQISQKDFEKETKKIEDFIENIPETGVDDPILKTEIIEAKRGALGKVGGLYRTIVDSLKNFSGKVKRIGKIAVPALMVTTLPLVKANAQDVPKIKEPKPIERSKVDNSKLKDKTKKYVADSKDIDELVQDRQTVLNFYKKYRPDYIITPVTKENMKNSSLSLNFDRFDYIFIGDKNNPYKQIQGVKKSIPKKPENPKKEKSTPSKSESKPKISKNNIPKIDKIKTIDSLPVEVSKDIPKSKIETGGFTSDVPGYPTIKIQYDKQGKPVWYENQAGDRIPYDVNSPSYKFTKEFAYPDFEPFKKEKK